MGERGNQHDVTEGAVVHVCRIPVRWSDFDRFGHLTNSAYVEVAQEARLDWAHQEVVQVKTTSFTTRQTIKNEKGEAACVVECVQIAMDLKTASPRAIEAHEMKVLARGKSEESQG